VEVFEGQQNLCRPDPRVFLLKSYLFCVFSGQILSGNVNRFQGGLVFKAHRLVHHSTLGVRVIKKEEDPRVFLLESYLFWFWVFEIRG